MIKTLAFVGLATAGGFMVAQQLDNYMSEADTKFDDKWKPSTKEAMRNGIAAASAVGLFAVLKSAI